MKKIFFYGSIILAGNLDLSVMAMERKEPSIKEKKENLNSRLNMLELQRQLGEHATNAKNYGDIHILSLQRSEIKLEPEETETEENIKLALRQLQDSFKDSPQALSLFLEGGSNMLKNIIESNKRKKMLKTEDERDNLASKKENKSFIEKCARFETSEDEKLRKAANFFITIYNQSEMFNHIQTISYLIERGSSAWAEDCTKKIQSFANEIDAGAFIAILEDENKKASKEENRLKEADELIKKKTKDLIAYFTKHKQTIKTSYSKWIDQQKLGEIEEVWPSMAADIAAAWQITILSYSGNFSALQKDLLNAYANAIAQNWSARSNENQIAYTKLYDELKALESRSISSNSFLFYIGSFSRKAYLPAPSSRLKITDTEQQIKSDIETEFKKFKRNSKPRTSSKKRNTKVTSTLSSKKTEQNENVDAETYSNQTSSLKATEPTTKKVKCEFSYHNRIKEWFDKPAYTQSKKRTEEEDHDIFYHTFPLAIDSYLFKHGKKIRVDNSTEYSLPSLVENLETRAKFPAIVAIVVSDKKCLYHRHIKKEDNLIEYILSDKTIKSYKKSTITNQDTISADGILSTTEISENPLTISFRDPINQRLIHLCKLNFRNK